MEKGKIYWSVWIKKDSVSEWYEIGQLRERGHMLALVESLVNAEQGMPAEIKIERRHEL